MPATLICKIKMSKYMENSRPHFKGPPLLSSGSGQASTGLTELVVSVIRSLQAHVSTAHSLHLMMEACSQNSSSCCSAPWEAILQDYDRTRREERQQWTKKNGLKRQGFPTASSCQDKTLAGRGGNCWMSHRNGPKGIPHLFSWFTEQLRGLVMVPDTGYNCEQNTVAGSRTTTRWSAFASPG